MIETKLKDEDIKDLTSSLYLIHGLYAQMSSEREHLSNAVSHSVNAVKRFQGSTKEFEGQTQRIPALIRQTLQEESRTVAKLVVDKTHEEITQHAKKTLEALEVSIQNARIRFEECGRKEQRFSRWFLGFMLAAALVGAIVGGLCGAATVHYGPAPRPDNEAQMRLDNGDMLAQAWPQLTKAERERLLALGKG